MASCDAVAVRLDYVVFCVSIGSLGSCMVFIDGFFLCACVFGGGEGALLGRRRLSVVVCGLGLWVWVSERRREAGC